MTAPSDSLKDLPDVRPHQECAGLVVRGGPDHP
ncbi:MAG: hypothetical protein H6Q86_2112, partial [candidate division NC10 bacterium]|nr:hypothetical protein [candidate division NC10 bacterium]